jgi:hypothetical protein
LSVDGTVRQRQTVSAFTEVQYCKLNCEQLQPTVRYTLLMSPSTNVSADVPTCAYVGRCTAPPVRAMNPKLEAESSGVKMQIKARPATLASFTIAPAIPVACRLDLYRKDFLCFLPNQAEDANCQCLAATNARLPRKPHRP